MGNEWRWVTPKSTSFYDWFVHRPETCLCRSDAFAWGRKLHESSLLRCISKNGLDAGRCRETTLTTCAWMHLPSQKPPAIAPKKCMQNGEWDSESQIFPFWIYNARNQLSQNILYYTILYYAMLCYAILYYSILYYTTLYYTILYYTILYYNNI